MPRRALALGFAIVASAALARAGPLAGPCADAPIALPGPAPQSRASGIDAAVENAACEACHADVAAEWRGSLHQRAWDDPVFLSAYAIEPQPFCRGCHAPEAALATLASDGPKRRIGVGCVTCHVQAGGIVSARGATAASGHHAVLGDARLATEQACGRCHEFAFLEPQRAPMQGTVAEHRASRHAAASCASCHMPVVRGAGAREGGGRERRDHAFRVAGDARMLRSAISARARRTEAGDVVVSLAVTGAGHAVPTGDMFRRLEVSVRADDGAALSPPTVTFARRFAMTMSASGRRRVEVGDDRLPPDGSTREARFALERSSSAVTVRWRLVYRRMDTDMAETFGFDSNADDVTLAEGALPPPTLPRKRP